MTTAKAAAFALAVTLLSGACREPYFGGPEYEVRAATYSPWSGARLDFFSDGFTPPAEPCFSFEGTLLAGSRRDDTTYTVSLPAIPSSVITVDVIFVDDTVSVGPLHLHGFRDGHRGPALKGAPHVWPAGGSSLVVADSIGLVQYDLINNVITQRWPDSLHWSGCNYGPGVSFRPDHFVLQRRTDGACVQLMSWRISGEPLPADSIGTGLCCGWALAEMSPGVWLDARDDKFYVWRCVDGACTRERFFAYTTEDAVLSPRGDRLALGGFYSPDTAGPWVLDATTGEKAFSIPALYETYAAAFSEAGDTIYVVGRSVTRRSGAVLVLALDALGGTVHDSTTLPAAHTLLWPAAIALDPLADLIYVAGDMRGDTLVRDMSGREHRPLQTTLLVFRRSTLDLVTMLRVPVTAGLETGVELGIVPAPLYGVVYVIRIPRIYVPPDWPVAVYRFDRAP